MSLPKVKYIITRDDEIGKYSLEDEYGPVLKDVHLADLFIEIDSIETDDGFNPEEPDIHELRLGKDE